MDLNNLLVWIVCLSCASLLLRMARLPLSYYRGWMIVCTTILVITGILLYIKPAIAGLIAASLWAILVILPLFGLTKLNQLIFEQRYSQASKLAAILRWLHPADGWMEQPKLLEALFISQRGDMAKALKILNRYQTTTSPLGLTAIALVYRMAAHWQELLLWIETNLPSNVLFKHPDLMVLYLRALGETGDLNRLLQEWERFEHTIDKTASPLNLKLMPMFALAFCGETAQVQKLFDGSLAKYSTPNMRQFWLATAQMAAGNVEAGEQLLALRDRNDLTLNNAISWRLQHPPVNAAEVLTDSSWQTLSNITHKLKQEARYGGALTFIHKKVYATYALIGLNLLFFALEIISGGSENLDNLYRLGALVPEVVLQGEWWRLLTANFLHYGFLHLAMNMLGLYFLGAFVESTLGIWRYLVSYLVSGVGAMLAISILAVMLSSPPNQMVVGASASIMGMIGVIAAILFQGWRKEKASIAAKRLKTVLFIIGLQVVFDLTTPQVSFLGHTLGLIFGFITGSLLLYKWKFKE